MASFAEQIAAARDARSQQQVHADAMAARDRRGLELADQPDLYAAEIQLSDDEVVKRVQSGGGGGLMLLLSAYGPATQRRLDDLRTRGVVVDVRDHDIPTATGPAPGKLITLS